MTEDQPQTEPPETEPPETEPPETEPPETEQPELKPPESIPPVSAEDLVGGEVDETVEDEEERRYPSTIGGAFYLLVLGIVGAGLVVVLTDEWRLGIRIMGGALMGAALIRLVLRARDAGMLAVRHKLLDAAVLIGLGAALIFLAGSIPDQPGF